MNYTNKDEIDSTDRDSENSHKEQLLKQILSSEARFRLNNIKMVKPELAKMVENYLINVVSQGKVNYQISDEQLKQLLRSVQQPKRDFKINRI